MEESARFTRSMNNHYSPISTPASSGSPASSTTTTHSWSPIKPRRTAKLTDEDRTEICNYRLIHPTTKQDSIAQLFGVERSTVSKILKFKDKYLALGSPHSTSTSPLPHPSLNSFGEPVMKSKGRFPSLETAVLEWAREQVSLSSTGFHLSDAILHTKAVELAAQFTECEKFKASAGWLEKFKERAGIVDGMFVSYEGEIEQDPTTSTSGASQELLRETEMMIDSEDEGMETSSISTRSTRKDSRKKLIKRPGHSRRNSEIAPPTAAAVIESVRLRSSYSPVKYQYVDTNAGYSPQSLLLLQQERNSERVKNVPSVDNPSYYPFTFGQSSTPAYPGAGSLDYPLQSPFQPTSSISNSTIQSQGNSTTNSPRNYLVNHQQPLSQHARSPSTTSSINSNFSSLTSFSNSQNSTSSSTQNIGTPLTSSNSCYSLVSNSGTASLASLPTTPGVSASSTGTGYFGHGSDGQQSQLQFAFGSGSSSIKVEHHSGLKRDGSWLEGGAVDRNYEGPYISAAGKKHFGVPRRATISGGISSFTGYNTAAAISLQQHQLEYHSQQHMKREELEPSVFPHHHSEPVPSLEPEFAVLAEEEEDHIEPDIEFQSCLQSLEQAMRYLSTKGNGFVTPSDLIVLSDLKGKMMSHHSVSNSRTSSPIYRNDRELSQTMTTSQSMNCLPSSIGSSAGGRHNNLISKPSRMERTNSIPITGGRSSRRLSGITPNTAIHNGFMNHY